MSKFLEYNNNLSEEDSSKIRCVGSLDVVGLYPALRSKDSAEEVRQTILESDIDIKVTNEKELGILARKVLTTNEIEEKGLSEIVPRKNKRCRNKRNNST